MNIKTKYWIWDKVFIINFNLKSVFESTVESIDIWVDEEWKEISYDLRVEVPVGLVNSEYSELGDMEESEIYPTKKDAVKALAQLEKEEEEKVKAKEKREAEYKELQKEFSPVKDYTSFTGYYGADFYSRYHR